jgi:hypothetical protein
MSETIESSAGKDLIREVKGAKPHTLQKPNILGFYRCGLDDSDKLSVYIIRTE